MPSSKKSVKILKKPIKGKTVLDKKTVSKDMTDSNIKSTSLKTQTKKDPAFKKASKKQTVKIRDYKLEPDKAFKIDSNIIQKEIIKKITGAPEDLEISLEPVEDNFIVYQQTPGFTSLDKPLAQLSVRVVIYNKGSKPVDLDKVVFEYDQGSKAIKKKISLPSDKLIIDPNYAWAWQNSRDYHKSGDVIYLEFPFPEKLTINLYFKKFSIPLIITKDLKPYSVNLDIPFKSIDFSKEEYLTGYSMHGGGEQVFGYDVGVKAFEKNGWRELYWGKDGKENKHFRIWGKPVYAMADGKVLHYENNIPNNWKPDGSKEGLLKQENELWGSFDLGGSGNHFYIKHGKVVALYAHLQKGSLNKKFLKKGNKIKKGDLLGKAGNSGNSTAPHFHFHIKTFTKDSEPEGGIFRPLIFSNGYVIGQKNYLTPKSNINWTKLNEEGIPGLNDKACFIFPSERHPYCEYPNIWGEVCKFGIPEKNYQEEFDKIWTCGYYPVWVNAFDVKGITYFNVIFRPSKNIDWVAGHNMDGSKFQNEFDKLVKEKYRLININSYLHKGNVKYAAVWIKDSSIDWFAYHGKTLSWHENNFKKYSKADWVPVNVSCLHKGSKTYVSALWEKKNTGGFYLRPEMKLEEFVNSFKQYTDKEKFKLVYLDGYVKNGKPRLSGIWYKNAPGYNSWWEKHHKTENQFQSEYNSMLKNGYLTRCIAGYSHNSESFFEGIWSK